MVIQILLSGWYFDFWIIDEGSNRCLLDGMKRSELGGDETAKI